MLPGRKPYGLVLRKIGCVLREIANDPIDANSAIKRYRADLLVLEVPTCDAIRTN
jgi:hypothetical protein